jgi:hypothetical protein
MQHNPKIISTSISNYADDQMRINILHLQFMLQLNRVNLTMMLVIKLNNF